MGHWSTTVDDVAERSAIRHAGKLADFGPDTTAARRPAVFSLQAQFAFSHGLFSIDKTPWPIACGRSDINTATSPVPVRRPAPCRSGCDADEWSRRILGSMCCASAPRFSAVEDRGAVFLRAQPP
jgi:hypothetical protein